jgi:rare lipoprotein A
VTVARLPHEIWTDNRVGCVESRLSRVAAGTIIARVRGRGWVVAVALAVALPGCALFRTRPAPAPVPGDVQTGVASWYGPGFHGRRTANGERFDQHALTAAHPSLPFGTRARVTSLVNERSVDVRINDRGPFVGGRIIDLSRAAASELDMLRPGVMRVRVDVLEAAEGRRIARVTEPVPRPPPPMPAVPPVRPAPAYVIRLGTFVHAEDAERLRRLVAQRFPDAYVSPLDTGRQAYYRVQLGPYGARRSADARAALAGRLGYTAVVLAEPAR